MTNLMMSTSKDVFKRVVLNCMTFGTNNHVTTFNMVDKKRSDIEYGERLLLKIA